MANLFRTQPPLSGRGGDTISQNCMNKTTSIVIVAMVVVAGILYFTQHKSPAVVEDGMEQSMDTNNPTATDNQNSNQDTIVDGSIGVQVGTGTENVRAVVRNVPSGSNFKFDPATMAVNKGDHVTITFKNSGGTHDFRIDEFGVATKMLQSNQEETVSFTADKAGSFEYYCSFGSHRQMGMKGTLTVK